MLAGQISANDLRSNIEAVEIDAHAFPTVSPLGIGEEAAQHLGVEIALALEMPVEPATREARARHNLLDRYLIESEAIEELASAMDDLSSRVIAVRGRVAHDSPRWLGRPGR